MTQLPAAAVAFLFVAVALLLILAFVLVVAHGAAPVEPEDPTLNTRGPD